MLLSCTERYPSAARRRNRLARRMFGGVPQNVTAMADRNDFGTLTVDTAGESTYEGRTQMTTKTGEPAVTQQPRRGVRGGFDVAYSYVTAFFVLGVLAQVFLAGVGIFGINAIKVANATSLNPHRAWGTVLMVISLIMLIMALVAWASRGTVIGTFVLALLVIVAQSGLAAAGESNKWLGGLHALDGMVILLLSIWLAIAAWRRRQARRAG